MRRITLVLVVLAAVAAGVVLAGALALDHACGNLRAQRVARHCIARLARLHLITPGAAQAAGRLEFHPVPPESAELITRRAGEASAPVPPPTAPPETPTPPEPPRIVKSGDIMRVGSDIHVARDEVVHGSVSAIGGDVTVDGHVQGDVSAMRGDVFLGSTARVDGDVVSVGGQLHEEPGAYVGGQRVTAMPGRRMRHLRALHREEEGEGMGAVGASFVWLIVLLAVSLGIVQLAPGRTAAAVETLRRAPLLSFGIGGLILALIIPSVIALCLVVAFLIITIIGIPLALAALVGYWLFFAVFGVWGFVVGAGAVGGVLIARQHAAAAVAAGDPTTPPARRWNAAPVVRGVMAGVLAMTGTLVIGAMLGSASMPAPFRVLGGFMFVISIIALSITMVTGGGAWLRSEFATGMLGRWWDRRKPRGAPVAPAVAAAPPPAAPPPAPLPPEAWQRPAGDPPPGTV